MTEKDIAALQEIFPHMVKQIYEQGKSAQRLEDAQNEYQIDAMQASQSISAFNAILHKPDEKEMN